MAGLPNSDKQIPTAFLELKSNAAMSTSELARRADLSLNTVKAFLKGQKVRETTVQCLNEALHSYIADRQLNAPSPDNITELYSHDQSAHELADAALRMATSFVETLERALAKSFEEGTSFNETIQRKIQMQLRMANAMLDI